MDTDKETITNKEKPPSKSRQMHGWRVALVGNIKGKTILPPNAPHDAEAEFDSESTIQAICQAIESGGHHAFFLTGDATLPTQLQKAKPDICFNFAEGLCGDAREAQVPALFELLGFPYTGSRVLASAISLNKTLTKQVWRLKGLPTAPFQEFHRADEPLDAALQFPLFAKPVSEGTGKGIDENALVQNERQLRRRLDYLLDTYKEPALVETFLPGREFTVAVLGRSDAALYSRLPQTYASDGFHRFHPEEIDCRNAATSNIYSYQNKTINLDDPRSGRFVCPAPIDTALEEELNTLAIQAHQAIGALDISRVDFRCDADGNPQLMEINTMPGMAPNFSDYCLIINASHFAYQDLILEVLYLAAGRWGLLPSYTQQDAQSGLSKQFARPRQPLPLSLSGS
jgi:D-alanine-D-alanine ligase